MPFLWRFHAIHHSAETLDWLAGSRMHLAEVRRATQPDGRVDVLLGFAEGPLYAYLFFVYLSSTLIHSNLRADRPRLKTRGLTRVWATLERLVVTPRFHHWHHGREAAAIDVNFAVHFPWLDRLFGTHHLPPGDAGKAAWPESTGVAHDPPPAGFALQFLYPFRRGA